MELTRKQAIEELKAILEMQYENVPLSKAALEMAISSLKTDEAYQIMYEGEDIYTKADLMAMLEEIILEIDEMDCTIDHDFEGYYTGHVDCQKLIREKINLLKENTDDARRNRKI